MFWSKKPKKNTGKPSRETIMAELKNNAQNARDTIGQDNLNKLAAQISGKPVPDVNVQESAMMKAKETLKKMDNERLADNIRAMAKDDY